mgnify:FL=1
MSEKVSILTLRLTAEEAAQMEVLKSITGKKSGSEAIKYIVKEYPRFCAHYKQEAREKGELQRKYQDQKIAVGDFLKAFERLQQTMEDDRKESILPMSVGKVIADFSGRRSRSE